MLKVRRGVGLADLLRLTCCGLEDGDRNMPPSHCRRKNQSVAKERLEDLTRELFYFHDLNGDGYLDEAELIMLNESIAILHEGEGANTQKVRKIYRAVFRDKLDPEGRPVPYETFRAYTREVLAGLDTDPRAQEMILEQFVAEAQSCRQAFPNLLAGQRPLNERGRCHEPIPPPLVAHHGHHHGLDAGGARSLSYGASARSHRDIGFVEWRTSAQTPQCPMSAAPGLREPCLTIPPLWIACPGLPLQAPGAMPTRYATPMPLGYR